MEIYQVHWATRPFCQLVHQNQFLTSSEAVSGVYGQIQIAIHPPLTGSQRAEQNSQSDPRLCIEGGQNPLCEILVLRLNTCLSVT